MYRIHRSFLFAAIALLLPLSSQATLLHYWNFFDQSKADLVSDGLLETHWSGIGLSVEGFDTDTELNRQDGFPTGYSLSFFDPVAVFSDHTITLSNLDLSANHSVTLSFAIRSNALLEIGEYLDVSYNIGDGWQSIEYLTPATPEWSLRTVDFGDFFFHHSEVSLRISHLALFEVTEFLDFANISLTAVPEPSQLAFIFSVVILTTVLYHKTLRRRGSV